MPNLTSLVLPVCLIKVFNSISLLPQVKIWFQNRRVKHKKDGPDPVTSDLTAVTSPANCSCTAQRCRDTRSAGSSEDDAREARDQPLHQTSGVVNHVTSHSPSDVTPLDLDTRGVDTTGEHKHKHKHSYYTLSGRDNTRDTHSKHSSPSYDTCSSTEARLDVSVRMLKQEPSQGGFVSEGSPRSRQDSPSVATVNLGVYNGPSHRSREASSPVNMAGGSHRS